MGQSAIRIAHFSSVTECMVAWNTHLVLHLKAYTYTYTNLWRCGISYETETRNKIKTTNIKW